MTKIDDTIETLLGDVTPMKPVVGPWQSFVVWALMTFSATVVLVLFSSPRPDLLEQLNTPLFLTEVIDLAALILSAALVAVWLCFPDLLQKRWVVYLPLGPLVLYIGLAVYRAFHPGLTTVLTEDADNGPNCVLCITMYGLVPAFWMFRTLRRHATVYPRLAGALSLLTAASIGLFVLKFVEGNDSIGHLLLWHILPVLLFGMLGAWLGKCYLAW